MIVFASGNSHFATTGEPARAVTDEAS